MTFPLPELLVGAGTGLVIGALARRAARRAVASGLVLGDREMAARFASGKASLERDAPPEVRAAIHESVDAGLAWVGLTRERARQIVRTVESAREVF